jgi:uncharacterized protein with HEPN domain
MRGDEQRLADILDAARDAVEFFGSRSVEEIEGDKLRVAAAVQKVAVIGEAAARVSEETRLALAELPWREMIGMRNMVMHHYWEIDREVLWSTVTRSLPDLIHKLEANRHRWPGIEGQERE